MGSRKTLRVWIGIILLSGMFLLGRAVAAPAGMPGTAGRATYFHAALSRPAHGL